MTSRRLLLMVVTYILLGVTASPGKAQIVPDITLPVNSTVTPNGNTFVIEGGTTAGSNLFHSFREFSIPFQQEAFFNNAPTINNIITRITGGQISNIDGLIRANGTANLFLINPNGIVFGNNARLNIGGSFLGSTARGIQFADGSVFSATEPNAPSLLTINVPIGLQLGQNPGAIRVEGTGNLGGFPNNIGLAVAPGKTLALVGGDVTLMGGVLTAESGRIEIGSVANSTVNLTPIAGGWRLGYDQVQEFRDIQLLNQSFLGNLNLSSNPSGGIQIQGRRIVLNQSQITAMTQGSQPGADIFVNASESVEIGGGANGAIAKRCCEAQIANQVAPEASGNGGSIAVITPELTIQDGGRIQTLTLGNGTAGNVTVNADSIVISGFAPPSGNVFENLNSRISSENYGAGAGGNVSVSTRNLTLLNGGRVETLVGLLATGNGGTVTVNVSDSIAGTGTNPFNPFLRSAIASQTLGAGVGGDISVTTRRLSLFDGALIHSQVQGTGKGGDVTVRVSESIAAIGVEPFTALPGGISAETAGRGDGGKVNVWTERLTIQSGATVSSSVFIPQFGTPGQETLTGNAGEVTVNADDVEIAGANSLSPFNASPSVLGSATFGSGNAGNVTLSTRRLMLKDGGSLSSIVFPGTGKGNGGNVTVNASESISVVGVAPLTFTPSILGTSTSTSGNAGNTIINTRQLEVRGGGQVSSSTRASGAAGKITINATESILVSGTAKDGTPSEVSANALIASEALRRVLPIPPMPTGSTGKLTIQTNRLTVQDGGRVSVLHEGTGDAGQLQIDAESVFLERSGRISASTASGQGGNIRLNVQDLLVVRSSSQIAAEAGGTGDGGNLTINTNLLALLDNSKITADAFKGKGGNVQISAQGLVVSPDSAITASSQLGIDGVVTINTLDVDLNSGFVELPTEVIDPSQQIIAGCPADRGNVFVIAGQGGLPPNPTQLLQQQGTWQDWRFLDNRDDRSAVAVNQESSAIADERTFQEDDTGMQGHTDAARNVSQDRHPDGNVQSRVPEHKSSVVEAAGWIINQSGQVQLVAQMPEAATQGSWYRSPQCAR